MAKSSSSSENEACCSKSCRKNTEDLNTKITKLNEALSDMLFLPPAQVYSPSKKDMPWTRLPEFVNDTITDNSRPSPSVERKSWPKKNFAHKNVTPRADFFKTASVSAARCVNSAAPRPNVNSARPKTTQDLVIIKLIQRVKRLERELKARTPSIKIQKADVKGRSRSVMAWVPKKTNGEAMINSIKNGDQPLPHVTQVSIAGTTSTEQPPLKDKSMWNLMDINIDALYNILKQNQGDVNDAMGSKKKTVVVTFDPLALIAKKTNVSKSKEKVVASSDSEGSEPDDFCELKKITALLAKAFNRR
nr:hypothetical protein [Tanacetum cinerariifolium]